MRSRVFTYCLTVASVLWFGVYCGDRCDEPRSTGPCTAYELRYFYNSTIGICQGFYWGGCNPTGNNFQTAQECRSACTDVCDQPQKIGPCQASIPRFFYNKQSGKCEKFFWGGCSPNENNFQTRRDCNLVCLDGCDQPQKIGPCNDRIPRFFYNKQSGRCEKFFWGGCRPNDNNFQSRQECNTACVDQRPRNLCNQPKKVGPCNDRIPRFFYNRQTGKCEKFFWGGCRPNDNNFQSKQECNAVCLDQRPRNVCNQPKKVGPCNDRIPRFFYNRQTGKCEKFFWGGCRQNDNNFQTRRECNTACLDQRPRNVCNQPKKVGPCKASIPRLFYNRQTGRCEKFFWGGCRPNDNNFQTRRECNTACLDQRPVHACDQPKQVGPCRLSIQRFFYNRRSGRCEQFYWGGCLPNENNFRTLIGCNLKCGFSWV